LPNRFPTHLEISVARPEKTRQGLKLRILDLEGERGPVARPEKTRQGLKQRSGHLIGLERPELQGLKKPDRD